MKEKVEDNRELAFLSRQLATIIVDIDFDEDLDAMVLEQPDASALAPVLEELEFRTLSRRILGDAVPASTPATAAAAPSPASASSSIA